MVRCFIAISLPTNDLLARVIAENKTMGKSIEGKNLHLTLKFLGEITDIDGIRRNLEEIRSEKFSITLRGMGAFPNAQSGRILFIRASPEATLGELAHEVDLRTAKIPLDHPFSPHITILRAKERRSFSEAISRYKDTIFLEHEVTYFSMYESILKPTGPIYNEIQRYQLM